MLVWFCQNLFTTRSSERLSISSFCSFQRVFQRVLNKSEMRSTSRSVLSISFPCAPFSSTQPPNPSFFWKERELPHFWLIPTNFQLREVTTFLPWELHFLLGLKWFSSTPWAFGKRCCCRHKNVPSFQKSLSPSPWDAGNGEDSSSLKFPVWKTLRNHLPWSRAASEPLGSAGCHISCSFLELHMRRMKQIHQNIKLKSPKNRIKIIEKNKIQIIQNIKLKSRKGTFSWAIKRNVGHPLLRSLRVTPAPAGHRANLTRHEFKYLKSSTKQGENQRGEKSVPLLVLLSSFCWLPGRETRNQTEQHNLSAFYSNQPIKTSSWNVNEHVLATQELEQESICLSSPQSREDF